MIHLRYSRRTVLVLVVLPITLIAQRGQQNVVPLKHWVTPLYWQPNQAERQAASMVRPELQFSANAVSTNALTFVAITPCRLVDTRGAAAGLNGIAPFSGPSIPPAGTLTIPVQAPAEATANTAPAPCGVIPSIAQAYSLNLTVVPTASGSVAYVSLWPAGSPQPVVATLNDIQGSIVANAAIVPAGSPSGGVSVYNAGPATTDVVIDMNGYFAALSDLNGNTAVGARALANNTTGMFNTANGLNALRSNTTGGANTASGSGALQSNTTGNNNTASGFNALADNTTGNDNTAIGENALQNNTTGQFNTAIGDNTLVGNTTGTSNTASGSGALRANTTGGTNTASGSDALASNTTGNDNTASGRGALGFNTTGNNNIAIGSGAALSVSGGE